MKNLRNKVEKVVVSMMVNKGHKKGLKKKFGGKEFIIELGFAAVAVFLLVLFRDKVGTFLGDLMDWVTDLIKNLFNNL